MIFGKSVTELHTRDFFHNMCPQTLYVVTPDNATFLVLTFFIWITFWIHPQIRIS